MSKVLKGGPAAARSEGRKRSYWKAEEGVTFLPGPKFKRVLRTLLESWHFVEESGIEVELVAFDEDDEIEIVHIHVEDAAPSDLYGDYQQYVWFNKAADRFEVIGNPVLQDALAQGFHGEGSLEELEEGETEKDSRAYVVVRDVVRWYMRERLRKEYREAPEGTPENVKFAMRCSRRLDKMEKALAELKAKKLSAK